MEDKKYKAEYQYSYFDKKGYRVNVFSYRGRDYEVQYNTEWTAKEQHKASQQNIDILIENSKKAKSTESADVGFKKWWEFLDT